MAAIDPTIFTVFLGLSLVPLGAIVFFRSAMFALTIISGAMMLVLFTSYDGFVVGDATAFVPGMDSFSPYNVDSSSSGILLNSVSRSIVAEYPVDSGSPLDGATFNCMSVQLGKIGSPTLAEPVVFGVFDGNGDAVRVFGSMNVTQISTSYTWYEHCVPRSNPFTIDTALGDRIGVKYEGGDASNTLDVRRDLGNPFGGTTTYVQQYSSGWSTFSTTNDLTMVLSLEGSDGEWVSTDRVEPFVPEMWLMMVLLSSFIMLVGPLVQFYL